MKTDRILGIIIYLLNHDHVPASRLAERFQVSVRTIQRDIVTISETGIPIYADAGKNGGYSILPNYKLNNAEIRKEEQQLVVKALESLATSYTSDTLKQLLEKYNAMVEKEGGQKVFWDFSVTKENQLVQDMNGMLEDAIARQRYITFDYYNANSDYFFPDCPIEPLENGRCRIFIQVPAKERLWKALLLSFGSRVKVVGPPDYRQELIETAEKFLSNYDTQLS